MATLKEHQAAMVQLLANGSGIPASASRLAHAMHDVLESMMNQAHEESMQQSKDFIRKYLNDRADATTPGLNDRALAEDIKAVRPKQVSAEQRVKQLENTVKQLRETNSRLRRELQGCRVTAELAALAEGITSDSAPAVKLPGQSGVRKEDTQVCEHQWVRHLCPDIYQEDYFVCSKCGAAK